MRLFAAFLLDGSVRAGLSRVASRLAADCDGVRWIPAEQVHLTVKFLGEVPDRDVVGVAQAMERGARRGRPFRMRIEGCGCFPPGGPVRIVWAGAKDETDAMVDCANVMCGEFEGLGFPSEGRAWSPHITIGRVKEDRTRGQIRTAVQSITYPALTQPVAAVTLMQSVLGPKGAEYTPVSTVPLGMQETTEGKGRHP